MHIAELKELHPNLKDNPNLLWNRHSEGFSLWFYEKVTIKN